MPIIIISRQSIFRCTGSPSKSLDCSRARRIHEKPSQLPLCPYLHSCLIVQPECGRYPTRLHHLRIFATSQDNYTHTPTTQAPQIEAIKETVGSIPWQSRARRIPQDAIRRATAVAYTSQRSYIRTSTIPGLHCSPGSRQPVNTLLPVPSRACMPRALDNQHSLVQTMPPREDVSVKPDAGIPSRNGARGVASWRRYCPRKKIRVLVDSI